MPSLVRSLNISFLRLAPVSVADLLGQNCHGKMAQFNDYEADYKLDVTNVTCTVNVGCQLNLQKIAENGHNVVYLGNKVTMRLRRPRVTAFIWEKGLISCVGATSEEGARIGIRCVARIIQKKGFDVELRQLRIVNVMARCTVPFRIKIRSFVERYRPTFYEPELLPGAIFKIPDLKAHLTIYSTGSIIIIAPNVASVHKAAKYIYPRVEEFRREWTAAEEEERGRKLLLAQQRRLSQ